MIAVISIIVSLGLLLPAGALIFPVRRPFAEKFALFLQRFGGLVLLAAVGLTLPAEAAGGQTADRLFVIASAAAWVLFWVLLAVWLYRWRQGRPMVGFDPDRRRYQPPMRLLFYLLGVIFLAGVIMTPKFQSADIPVAQHLIYLNLLSLLVLPLILAHRPFADRRRRVGRSITGSFLVCLLLLAVVLPSPIYTFDQLVVWSWGDRVSCRQGASSDWRPLSCREIVGPLPLLKPGTWTRQP